MILPIAKLPAHILRQPTLPITLPANKDILKLVKNMIHTCRSADGVGLAAPQVGKNIQLAIIFLEEAGLPVFPIINPVITKTSKEQTEMEEGCLSIPGVFGKVLRPKKITLEAYNLEGEKFTITDDTFLARVLQHEIDHLNHTLIIDKISEFTAGQKLLSSKYYETN